MEKNFILSVGMSVMFLFISSIKTVQAQQLGIGVKTELNGKVRFCNYDEAYFMPDTNTRIKVTGLEIAYDSSLNYYDIFANVKGDKVNFLIKYSNGGEGAYIYKGIDRISKMDVVVTTKKKLSLYANNYGVNSYKEVESSVGIIIVFPKTYMISSIVPIKNKVETVNELSTQLRKGVITDSDGYTNIRKSNSVNSEIIGKIVDREVFTYWETNDNWYIVQTAKGIKGYVHKSRIKPVEERNEQKIRYYKVKNGDKIQDIAEKLGVSIDTICKLNRVKITTVLREGQALRISR